MNDEKKNGLYCSAGFNWFSIGSEGRVSTCNSLIYRTDNGIYLGNILKDNIKLRTDEYGFKCPNQECRQVCDRHWSRKKIYKDDELIDEQPIVNESAYIGKNKPISILFAPTWKCNYSCAYCGLPSKQSYPSIPDVCDIFPPEKWIDAFTNFFNINNIDGGIWHTNGGEPLFYNGIEKLFVFFASKGFKVALTSNISADVYQKIVKQIKPEGFAIINCSLHPTDKNFKWELFKNRVELLKALNYPVSVNFVGHPDQIMLTKQYAEWCKDIDVNFSLIPIVNKDFLTIDSYPKPLRDIINKYSRLDLKDNNKFINGKRVENI